MKKSLGGRNRPAEAHKLKSPGAMKGAPEAKFEVFSGKARTRTRADTGRFVIDVTFEGLTAV